MSDRWFMVFIISMVALVMLVFLVTATIVTRPVPEDYCILKCLSHSYRVCLLGENPKICCEIIATDYPGWEGENEQETDVD